MTCEFTYPFRWPSIYQMMQSTDEDELHRFAEIMEYRDRKLEDTLASCGGGTCASGKVDFGQSISTGSETQITTFAAGDLGCDFTTDGTAFHVPLAGDYIVGMTLHWPSNSTGYRTGRLVRDGAFGIITDSTGAVNGIATDHGNSMLFAFNAGDSITCYVTQNSGGSLTVSGTVWAAYVCNCLTPAAEG